ncbi:IS200/IS605 family insertion sequence transposase domain-containing protein [Rhizobium gallicum]|uniref:IS200/IS605 family insertion sequence transposase domain-containing protein n=1 Tax=Rhizobium gallicum TaxID=56730 RepID=A0A1L5NG24_9HYPH|nr:IS200/IS605 family insertion sequence transposase domain-containing protein [Rhizobium gallicum]
MFTWCMTLRRSPCRSRRLRESRPEITGRYHKGVLWSPSSFAASCGGAPLSVIAEYVKSQREAAQGRSRVPPGLNAGVSREVHDELDFLPIGRKSF